MRRRVKITGIGPVTPAGIGLEAFYCGINEPVSHVRTLQRLADEPNLFVGAEIVGFDLKHYAPMENPRRLSRHSQFGLVGAMLALKDAGLTFEDACKYHPVVITGTSIMDIDKISRSVQAVSKSGFRHAATTLAYDSPVVTVAGKIVEYLGKPARMLVLQTSCCSGLDAIGHAAELIATGRADLVITGGSESPLTFHPLVEFNAAELNPTNQDQPEKACRPFDLWRSTGVLGEVAAILVLEPEDSPRDPYAWITGYGYANDLEGIAASGISDAVSDALANACRRPDEVDYINAWGTGHRQIDASEYFALNHVFGSRLAEIPVVSLKGSVGIALGASGAIQTASAALSMRRGIIPPTVNWETPDPDCPLNLSAQPRHIRPNVAIINAHGVSGSNACLVLEKPCQPCSLSQHY